MSSRFILVVLGEFGFLLRAPGPRCKAGREGHVSAGHGLGSLSLPFGLLALHLASS